MCVCALLSTDLLILKCLFVGNLMRKFPPNFQMKLICDFKTFSGECFAIFPIARGTLAAAQRTRRQLSRGRIISTLFLGTKININIELVGSVWVQPFEKGYAPNEAIIKWKSRKLEWYWSARKRHSEYIHSERGRTRKSGITRLNLEIETTFEYAIDSVLLFVYFRYPNIVYLMELYALSSCRGWRISILFDFNFNNSSNKKSHMFSGYTVKSSCTSIIL